MPTSIACGGTVSGEARDLDGALYAGPPVLIFASLHPHWSMIDTVGFAEVVDGRYSIQLEPEVCIGQAETFYLLAMDRDSGAPRGFHGDPSRPEDGPSPLSVHERERWGEPSVTIFVHIGGAPGFWEACPPEDEVGTVSGSVQDSAGDPVADAIVLLFDASAEPEPVPIDRFRDGVADAEGRFEISGVCTGSYHALAIQEDEQQSFFGFWDPDEDGQPDSFTITKEETERSGIVIHAIDPEWPEALPKPEGW